MPFRSPIRQVCGDAARFQWLETGAAALERMIAVIQSAEKSVELETYIFADDVIGCRMRDTLLEAVRRGVNVRVLVDAVGSIRLSERFWQPFIEAGGGFRWFNPFKTAERYGYRNHRKLCVIDRQLAIIGGFNIAGEYDGDGVEKGWRDLGMVLWGKVVEVLADSFEDLYAKADWRPESFYALRSRPDTEVQGKNWTLLFSGPGRGHRSLRRSLMRDLHKAREVRIICAYFVPPWRLRRALKRVVRRGGRVQLILAGKTDVWLSQLASQSFYSSLLQAGVELYEYQPQILHSKLFIIDDAVYVGSANLDARSLKLNYELLLRLDDHDTAMSADALFDADLRHSQSWHLRSWRLSRGWLRKVLEKLAYTFVVRLDPYLTRLRWRGVAEKAARKWSDEKTAPHQEGEPD